MHNRAANTAPKKYISTKNKINNKNSVKLPKAVIHMRNFVQTLFKVKKSLNEAPDQKTSLA